MSSPTLFTLPTSSESLICLKLYKQAPMFTVCTPIFELFGLDVVFLFFADCSKLLVLPIIKLHKVSLAMMLTTKAQVTFTLLQCAVLLLQQKTAMAHNYIVGDEAYWEVPPFPTYYDVWAARAGPFLMGDTLSKTLSIPPFSENQLHSNSCLTSHLMQSSIPPCQCSMLCACSMHRAQCSVLFCQVCITKH
jgi:hypothetical protein